MKNILVLLFVFGILSCSSEKETEVKPDKVSNDFKFNDLKKEFLADETIVFISESKINSIDLLPKLVVTNSFGTIIVGGEIANAGVQYSLPKIITRKIGLVDWKLVDESIVLQSGTFEILPNISKKNGLESYFGPRSISAGDIDFSMLVVIPSDVYDNPVLDGTTVELRYQFENDVTDVPLETDDLIAWYNVGAPHKSGRILVTALCNGVKSKELTSIVFPANATTFKIDYTRDHAYADGNQIIRFNTSIIKDEFGNVISDGTLVSFTAVNTKGIQLQAVGLSIGGVAIAKMLHPDKKDTWKVKAYVTGAAKSNAINVSFKTAFDDYPVNISKDNRRIIVGPITSFMNQLAPDGLLVRLAINDSDKQRIETKVSTLQNGKVMYYLDPDFYPDGNYEIEIKSAGIVKTYNLNLDGSTD
ncbi:hypothetical protein KO500_09560 [Cellulophaga baltica]|uniref:hypothetical protein n=1 Tax=Cellulophaga TaxID=104264 RepID=UPI001C06F524|nr:MULTISPECIES: hypothetical protein [Cellulophaga]MBU2996683.1 hypothetical protein [Cellulophaga baltica]MDO6768077.1 hypothetical protein [Cellulophaga sp. 1_MG-2023]